MSRSVLFVVFVVSCVWSLCNAANILYLMPTISRSHHVFHSVLVNELASRGHKITYVSPFIEKKPHPNVKRQILFENVVEQMSEFADLIGMAENLSPVSILKDLFEYSAGSCQLLYQTEGIQELKKLIQTEKFDLVINDFGLSDCTLGIVDAMPDTPLVGLTAFGGTVLANPITGNPESLATKPQMVTTKYGKMSFLDRVYNTLIYLYSAANYKLIYLPLEDKIMRTVYPQAPTLQQLQQRYDLLLLNDHFTLTPPTPTVPALVHVAGIHIRPPKPLPDDIKKFLDESKHGAVFFSLGTNILSSDLGEEKLKIILESLKELSPVRVLWKFEKNDLPGKPDNVMISQWLPQRDILAHPNVKVFISHAGLLSSLESLHRKVPVVGIPFLVDQHLNLKRAIAYGYAEKLDYPTLNKNEMVSTLKKVLSDPTYKKNAEKWGELFADQPEPPLERAVYWIEYVIRHKGAKHLRSDSLDLTWYQNELLDVALFLLVIVFIVVKIVVYILKLVVRLLFSSNKNKIKRN